MTFIAYCNSSLLSWTFTVVQSTLNSRKTLQSTSRSWYKNPFCSEQSKVQRYCGQLLWHKWWAFRCWYILLKSVMSQGNTIFVNNLIILSAREKCGSLSKNQHPSRRGSEGGSGLGQVQQISMMNRTEDSKLSRWRLFQNTRNLAKPEIP